VRGRVVANTFITNMKKNAARAIRRGTREVDIL
jgi:hypothetical protein